jgi:capsular exopolysaccharide synthesis family protein
MQSSDSALRQYLRTIRRQAWLVVLVPVLVVTAMYVVSKTQDPVYRASTSMVVGQQPRGETTPEFGDFSFTRNMTKLLEGDYIARTVIRNLRLGIKQETFEERLNVAVLPETSILDVSYDSTDPRLALGVIREINRIYPQYVDDVLGRRVSGSPRKPGSFEVVIRDVDPPHVLAEPVGPKTGANIIFGAAAGIALGLLLAVAREALDSRLRERKEAEQWFDAPIVGTLPKGMGGSPARTASTNGYDRRAATLDLLRARMQFTGAGINGPTILVADSGPDMGKSVVTANLGAALARGGKRVIVVDADIRRPRLHRALGLDTRGDAGLVDVLGHHAALDEALVPIEIPTSGSNGATPTEAAGHLELLPSGSVPAPLSDVITSDAVAELIEALNERADYVIFDSPPLSVAEAYPLAVRADNVLVVARRGRTTKDQAEWARETLDEIGVKNVGVVLTDSQPV